MTVHALITGSLFQTAESRVSKTGEPFVSATIRCQDGGESRFVRVVAFSEPARDELLRLTDGDCLSVQGPLMASIYTGADGNAKIGLSIVADRVLALHQPPRERKPKPQDTRARQERLAGTWSATSGDPNDSIPI